MFLRSSFFLGLTLVFLGCNKPVTSGTTQVIGHAATGLKMPNAIYHDNSEAGIVYTQNLPFCDGVEVDVRMDKSGELWLFHDETLNPETAESGCIETHGSEALSQFRYRGIHQEPLFLLTAESANIFKGKFTFFDLKPLNACENVLKDPDVFKNALIALGLDTASFAVIVPDQTYLHALKDDFQVFLSIETLSQLTSSFLENEPKLRGVVIRNKSIRVEEVNFFKSIHKKVVIFEVRSAKGIKEALKKNPHYLLTDDVKLTVGLIH